MLQTVIQFLADEVNAYLAARTGADLIVVKPGRIVDDQGRYVIDQDSIAISIVNVEEERALRSQVPSHTLVGGQQVLLEPELKLNVHVLFAANYQKYDVAFQYISYVLTFFQSHPAFTSERFATLDPQIGRLTIELQSLTFEQLNHMWAFVGGKQLPSIVYKVRMVVLQDEEQTGIQLPITTIQAELRRR